jgi:hypothetical protein
MKFLWLSIFCFGLAVDTTVYVTEDKIPDGSAGEMAKTAPHIILSGQKLDYDPELESYVYAEVAKKGPFKGKKTRCIWLSYVDKDTGKTVRIMSDTVNQIDPTTGIQYDRHNDGEWEPNGKVFEKDGQGHWVQKKQ